MHIEIREWLSKYIRGEVMLREFQEWFVPVTWEINDEDALELTKEIELLLAEFTNGHRTEAECKVLLRPLCTMYGLQSQPIRLDSSSPTIFWGRDL